MQKISDYKVVVVGSGLFGLTIARKIVEEYSLPVVVIEKRKHIGGNSYSYDDPETGIEIHKYGSHLFHTSNEGVWKYVNRFSKFSDYRHTVWTKHNSIAYSMPVNLSTIQQFYSRYYSPAEASELIKSLGTENIPENENFEERAIRLIGRPMYEAFIKNYTYKQWQTDPKLLPAEIISRLPVRTNFNSRYFNDIYEGLPVDGYGKFVSRMAEHPCIDVMLDTDFFKVRDS